MLYEFDKTVLLPEIDNQLDQTIKSFSTHDLSGLANSSLMNRVDSKFLLPVSSLIQVLNACNSSYSLLMINGISIFQYDNIYFDNTELHFYNNHHNRKLNRHKVRHRHYADVGTSYLEVKFKNNKGRTIKNRCLADKDANRALSDNYAFLQDNGIDVSSKLIPSQACSYRRISLANDARKERLTLDLNINFASKLKQAKPQDNYTLSDFYIAELKQEKLDRQSPFYRLMREISVRPIGFSKYCMGQSLTNNKHIKSNRFKMNLMKLKKGA
ncbi:MAG: polyphosphate polymerase domain-containing protein [Porticoccaceae bacterium]|nr:polyphosphate polymerase domain-containing protein [Porticoccaceae bacterium]